MGSALCNTEDLYSKDVSLSNFHRHNYVLQQYHNACVSFFRSVIQAKLLQSPEVSGVHPNKLAHPEDEGDVPQKNR